MSWQATDDRTAAPTTPEERFEAHMRAWHFRVGSDWTGVDAAAGLAWHGLTELAIGLAHAEHYEGLLDGQLDRLTAIEAFSLGAIGRIFSSYEQQADQANEKARTRADCRTARRLLRTLAEDDADLGAPERLQLAEVCRAVLERLYARTRRQAFLLQRA